MIKLFAVKDKASNTTNDPFPCPTNRDAIEGLRQVVNDGKTTIAKHPEDFDLYNLGEYNPRTMDFVINSKPEFIISATELQSN